MQLLVVGCWPAGGGPVSVKVIPSIVYSNGLPVVGLFRHGHDRHVRESLGRFTAVAARCIRIGLDRPQGRDLSLAPAERLVGTFSMAGGMSAGDRVQASSAYFALAAFISTHLFLELLPDRAGKGGENPFACRS